MDTIVEWFGNNHTWVFSGIGIFIIGGVIAIFKRKGAHGISQKQRSGNNSTNIQVGGNVEFTQKNDK